MSLKEPIVEGAWYLLFNGQLSRSNELTLKKNEFGQVLCPRCGNPTRNSGDEFICADTYQDCGHVSRGEPGVQVWFVPTDPRELVIELRSASNLHGPGGLLSDVYAKVADRVAEKLGVGGES